MSTLDPIALKSLALELAAAMPPVQAATIDYPAIDSSRRARRARAILRIADAHGWHSAITDFMDSVGTGYLSDLTDDQLDRLHEQMERYVDSAMTGCSPADCPPAI